MNWHQYQAALQLLAEEKVGSVMREAERQEDVMFDRSYRQAREG
jgi:hypothetical protein